MNYKSHLQPYQGAVGPEEKAALIRGLIAARMTSQSAMDDSPCRIHWPSVVWPVVGIAIIAIFLLFYWEESIMKEKLTINDVTQEVKSYVSAYLMQAAYSATMREKVDKVHREILTECPIYADRHGRTEQILTSGDLYKCSNEGLCRDFYNEADRRLKNVGLKPQDMECDFCPALVAEHDLVKIGWNLIEAGARMIGDDKPKDFNNRLLCDPNGKGLERKQKFIDLLVGLVVNLPDFKNPITGQKLAA